MCCFFTALLLFGPRLAILVWWIWNPVYINTLFQSWIWPLLGLIFLPWTTLMFTLVYPIIGLDWLWLGLAVLADISAYAAGAARRRDASFYRGP